MIDPEKYKYPSLDGISAIYPSPKVLLNQNLYVTVKEDGQNIGVFAEGTDIRIRMRTRHETNAPPEIYRMFEECEGYEAIKNVLIKDYTDFGENNVIFFCELMVKGKSPTRIKEYDKPQFKVFDIYSIPRNMFIPRVDASMVCGLYKIPIVDLEDVIKCSTLDELYSERDRLMEVALKKNYEGFVIKTWFSQPFKREPSEGKLPDDNTRIFVKEKPPKPKRNVVKTAKKEQLPELHESEVKAAVHKILVKYGEEDFMNKKITMPRIAEIMKEECMKDGEKRYSPPHNLIDYYNELRDDLVANK